MPTESRYISGDLIVAGQVRDPAGNLYLKEGQDPDATPGLPTSANPGEVLRWNGTQWAAHPTYLEHVQTTPVSTVTITHNKACYPDVEVVDSAGTVGEPDISYPSNNAVTITLGAAMSFTARLYL